MHETGYPVPIEIAAYGHAMSGTPLVGLSPLEMGLPSQSYNPRQYAPNIHYAPSYGSFIPTVDPYNHQQNDGAADHYGIDSPGPYYPLSGTSPAWGPPTSSTRHVHPGLSMEPGMKYISHGLPYPTSQFSMATNVSIAPMSSMPETPSSFTTFGSLAHSLPTCPNTERTLPMIPTPRSSMSSMNSISADTPSTSSSDDSVTAQQPLLRTQIGYCGNSPGTEGTMAAQIAAPRGVDHSSCQILPTVEPHQLPSDYPHSQARDTEFKRPSVSLPVFSGQESYPFRPRSSKTRLHRTSYSSSCGSGVESSGRQSQRGCAISDTTSGTRF